VSDARRANIGPPSRVLVDAVVSAANPLLYRAIIDKDILAGNAALIVWLAVLVAVLALTDAILGRARLMVARAPASRTSPSPTTSWSPRRADPMQASPATLRRLRQERGDLCLGVWVGVPRLDREVDLHRRLGHLEQLG
jgi:hypothetical protein